MSVGVENLTTLGFSRMIQLTAKLDYVQKTELIGKPLWN